jgi:hypothetical protein
MAQPSARGAMSEAGARSHEKGQLIKAETEETDSSRDYGAGPVA